MQRVFLVGDEPIPGNKLLEDRGGTAFYKMWKVRTPSGSVVMWKVIDMVVGNAAIETRTLGLLVTLRHPFLSTLTNFWQLDDGKTLIIESEVPQSSLRERLNQCMKQGQSGLPAEEVFTYLEQAAEGLDFLNSPRHQFQGQQVAVYHRSLRPECLLLFTEGGKSTCKVSDFGLSKPVTEEVSQHSQGLIHYDYDPPEFFEGQTLQVSDQYSLAINYYELRTGSLPFTGTMLEQLQARLNDAPNLSLIQEPERSAVRRALSKEPSQRYENCLAFAKAVRQAAGSSAMAAAPTPAAPRPGQPNRPPQQPQNQGGEPVRPMGGYNAGNLNAGAAAIGNKPNPVFGNQTPAQQAAAQMKFGEDPNKKFGSDGSGSAQQQAASKPAAPPTGPQSGDMRSIRQQAGTGGRAQQRGGGGGGSGTIPMGLVAVILVIFVVGGLAAAWYFKLFPSGT